MSRLRRLKELRRKNRIKATACGLALALAIGSSQGLGTYALFTDVEDVPSDIAISTGDVDVKVSEGKNFTDVQPGDNIEIPFIITNKGTLNQNVSLKLDIATEISQYLTSTIIFNTSDITIKGENLYNNTGLLVLSPGQTINGSINIIVDNMSSETQNTLYGNEQKINLTVKSTQINESNTLVNDGFYDIETQLSTITIGEQNVIYGGAVKVTPASGYDEDSTVGIRVSNTTHYSGLESVIDNIGDVDKKYIEIISKNGAFEYTTIFNIGEQWYTFDKRVNTTLITEKFGDGNDISVKLKYKDGSYKTYKFDFKIKEIVSGNRLLAVKVTLESSIPTSVIDVIESLNEEVEKPAESGVVEQPKEEVEKSTEPETTEQQKEEMIETLSQPEAIEPPKEGEIIQE
ncbi:TasA family protein [Romboutsia timonensis]|uniref:TasA family protein n=1 Tax=Romboutsia timonensis TaxID=1776391 RepID=UPI002A82D440|nr:TasA family protein [Romboutsia timonensis]MDY3960016.1 TasA family protein [Romboutsia timonensis]